MKIALLGYGRMGKAIEKSAKQRAHEIVYKHDKNEVEGDLSQADIAINFSVPNAALENIKLALKKQIPVVCGTTGWLEHYEEIVSFCNTQKSGFLYASNFSIGVNLFFKIINAYKILQLANIFVVKIIKSTVFNVFSY